MENSQLRPRMYNHCRHKQSELLGTEDFELEQDIANKDNICEACTLRANALVHIQLVSSVSPY